MNAHLEEGKPKHSAKEFMLFAPREIAQQATSRMKTMLWARMEERKRALSDRGIRTK